MDIGSFLAANKSMVIAPAGYGKTYTIAEILSAYKGKKKILVLTHTHAGIASLKEKFISKRIPSSLYQLDTICSFALNLTKTYHINKDEIPSENDVNTMFKYAVEHAILILKANPIKCLLRAKYDHLIVDEYQDCSVAQHLMILEMANAIKTHILGDPLQGIFGFKGQPIVNFEDSSFDPFKSNQQALDTPWRWINAGNPQLGKDLGKIRKKLIAGEDIDLRDYNTIEITIGSNNDYAIPHSDCKKTIFAELRKDTIIIHSNSTSINPRKSVVKQYPQLQLMESIDDKDYYKWCQTFDNISGQTLIAAVVNMLRSLSSNTLVNNWIKEDGTLKRKQKTEDQEITKSISIFANNLSHKKSYKAIVSLMNAIQNIPGITIYRKVFYKDICHILIEADVLGITASEALLRNRNITRRKGREVLKRSIGTTLLTKGLEFDNVVILNAQDFNDPKHLYVALTRCSKRLLVITDNPILHPYAI